MSFRMSQSLLSEGSPPLSQYSQPMVSSQPEPPPLLSRAQSLRYMAGPRHQSVSNLPSRYDRATNYQGDSRHQHQAPRAQGPITTQQEKDFLSSLERIQAKIANIPIELGKMLEKDVGIHLEKIIIDTKSLAEELKTLQKGMDSVIRAKEEEVGRYKEIIGNLILKHKSGMEDMKILSKQQEEADQALKALEDLTDTQSKMIYDLEEKLEFKKFLKIKPEELLFSHGQKQIYPALQSDSPVDLISISSDDEDEDGEEDMLLNVSYDSDSDSSELGIIEE